MCRRELTAERGDGRAERGDQALIAETTIRRRRSMASPSMMPADSSWASASSR